MRVEEAAFAPPNGAPSSSPSMRASPSPSRASDRYRPRVVVIAAARGGCREKSGEWMVARGENEERERERGS